MSKAKRSIKKFNTQPKQIIQICPPNPQMKDKLELKDPPKLAQCLSLITPPTQTPLITTKVSEASNSRQF